MAKKEESKGYYKLVDADIINNVAICPICHKIVTGGLDDYRQVMHDGESYTEFIKFCTTEGCFTKVRYQVEVSVDKDPIRHSFYKTEEIKEENIKGGDFNDTSI